MPPLNTTLVEVHQELANTTQVAKDMAKVCKQMRKASELTHEWSEVTQSNVALAVQLQQAESKL